MTGIIHANNLFFKKIQTYAQKIKKVVNSANASLVYKKPIPLPQNIEYFLCTGIKINLLQTPTAASFNFCISNNQYIIAKDIPINRSQQITFPNTYVFHQTDPLIYSLENLSYGVAGDLNVELVFQLIKLKVVEYDSLTEEDFIESSDTPQFPTIMGVRNLQLMQIELRPFVLNNSSKIYTIPAHTNPNFAVSIPHNISLETSADGSVSNMFSTTVECEIPGFQNKNQTLLYKQVTLPIPVCENSSEIWHLAAENSDITNGINYKYLVQNINGTESSITKTLIDGNEVTVMKWITPAKLWDHKLFAGNYNLAVKASKDGSTTYDVTLKFKLYTRSAAGVETELAVTPTTTAITSVPTLYDLQKILSETNLTEGDRVIVELTAIRGASGVGDPVVTIAILGSSGSIFSVPTIWNAPIVKHLFAPTLVNRSENMVLTLAGSGTLPEVRGIIAINHYKILK